MDKRRILNTIAKVALVSIPIILGFIGFADLYKDLGSRLYHTMAMFAFSFDAEEEYVQTHMYLQVARILAGAATFSVVVAIAYNFWATFSALIQIKLFGAIVVHGDGEQASRVLEGIRENGSKAISCSSRICYSGRNQVLAFDSDSETLRYIESHMQDFFPHGSDEGSRNNIVLCSNMYSNSECKREYFSIYNPAETCATEHGYRRTSRRGSRRGICCA